MPWFRCSVSLLAMLFHRLRSIPFIAGSKARPLARRHVALERVPFRFNVRIWRISTRRQEILEHLRSEEHTSELQSLMRISYAVFCLKKKKENKHDTLKTQTYNTIPTHTHHT